MPVLKSFLKQILVVVVGIFASLFLFSGAIALLISWPSKPKITNNTILQISLCGEVAEYSPASLTQLVSGEQDKTIDLLTIKDAIRHARADKNIRGIYLEINPVKAGWAILEEIRDSLLSFRQAGKFIVAYGDHYTQKSYYVASVADEIVLNPEAIFPLKGLNQTVVFYKTLLDRLEINPQVFRVGKYKSAVEPFTRVDMSPASRYQSNVLLRSIYDYFLDGIASARGLQKTSIKAAAETLSAVTPQGAHQVGLVSQVGHFDDAEALIKEKLKLDRKASIDYVSLGKYAALKKTPLSSEGQKIAVLVAEGMMVDGTGTSKTLGSKDVVASLRAIRKDKSIKAVVLRINSPGGSALAADVIWKELVLTRDCKPVVASMSDVAASGGYYLASACQRILAYPTTITGSIGIFGLFFDVHTLLRDKLGITTDVVKTSVSADLFDNLGRPFSKHEQEVIQKSVDKGYRTFLEKVALGRNMDKNAVADVAAGRVWTGQLAYEKGLVDEVGGLESAIQAAASLADLTDDEYTVTYWPRLPTLTEQIRNFYVQICGYERDQKCYGMALYALQASLPTLKHVQELIDMVGIQARLPYTIEIE